VTSQGVTDNIHGIGFVEVGYNVDANFFFELYRYHTDNFALDTVRDAPFSLQSGSIPLHS
jgi:hypothetical protein